MCSGQLCDSVKRTVDYSPARSAKQPDGSVTITRISEFQAREGQGDALRDLIRSFLPTIKYSDGCQSCELLQNQEDPTQIVVIEVWDSTYAHQASLKNIPPRALEEVKKLLVGPPKGAYYHS